jgi:MspA
MLFRRITVAAACMMLSVAITPQTLADPDPGPTAADAPAQAADATAPPADGGRVPAAAPATIKTPDGWTLTLSSKDETQRPAAPLTTALSTREYIVGGTFSGSLSGPSGEARGTLEAGYDIGCGIDMSTSNGVSISPGIIPLGVDVALKPGIVNIIPVYKIEFKGTDPWVMISNFHIKIDGCVGQSFIRSYATLTKLTNGSASVLNYVGVTKTV